ncbi:ATP binding domain 4, partial [Perkinsus olseni]
MVLAFMWRLPQDRLLDWIINTGIEARLVKVACMGLDERHLSQTLSQLRPYFTKLHNQFGFHVCGEGGEYETLTTDCPLYLNGRIDLGDTRVVKHSADVYYLQSANPHLEPKDTTTNSWNDVCTSLSILDSLEYYEQDYPRLESVHDSTQLSSLAPLSTQCYENTAPQGGRAAAAAGLWTPSTTAATTTTAGYVAMSNSIDV